MLKCLRIAEETLLEAIDWSRRHQSRSWELRCANSLAQLHLERNEPRQAAELLEPLYQQFTEGFDTADLMLSRSLLDKARCAPISVRS